jgi:tryptophan 7-halogenase
MRTEQSMSVRKIVIAGGGIAGWMTAAALARKTHAEILVIEIPGVDDSLGLPFVVEPTLPSTPQLHRALGFDLDALMTRSGASFTLGRALTDWTAHQAPAFHPFGEIGAALGPVAFHHLVARLRAEGESVNLANYSVAALCAQSARFAPPPCDSRSVLSTMEYGLHLEHDGYLETLKAEAIAAGAAFVGAAIQSATMTSEGLIDTVQLSDGQSIHADLFADCSGASRVLITQMPGVRFEDWSGILPCNRCITGASAVNSPPLPYTHVGAHENGWQSFAATRNIVGEALVYRHSGEERSAYRFTSGRINVPWSGNCIAIGGAAAIIDPVASSQLHLAGSAILRLINLFPHDRECRAESAEYNRQTAGELANVRDFAALHFKANGRAGEPFWDAARAASVPERLEHKIALYAGIGRLALYDEETFEASDWLALYDGLGVLPARYDTMAAALPRAQIEGFLQQVRTAMLNAVAGVPPHAVYLGQIAKGQG